MLGYGPTNAGREDRIDGQRVGCVGGAASSAFVSDHTSLCIITISDCSRQRARCCESATYSVREKNRKNSETGQEDMYKRSRPVRPGTRSRVRRVTGSGWRRRHGSRTLPGRGAAGGS